MNTGLPAIYYVIMGKPAAGGHFVNQEHVRSLRDRGYRAYLLNVSSEAEKKRMDGDVPTLRLYGTMQFRQQDVVVLPEPSAEVFRFFAGKPCKKVIHCQNPHYLFHGLESVADIDAYGAMAIFSCSSYTSSLLGQFGLQTPVLTITPAIPRTISEPTKRLQVAYMPRKRAIEATYIQGLFRSMYPQYRHIRWCAIDGVSRIQALEVLHQSAIFASFSHLEGLGLPPLEAMAAECLVVGFDGYGGTSYSRVDNGFWVPEGEYFDYAHSLAKAIEVFLDASQRDIYVRNGLTIAAGYDKDAFEESLIRAWRSILGRELNGFLLDPD